MDGNASKTPGAGVTPTLDEYRASVRYLLVTDFGMPELVADEVLAAEQRYIRQAFGDGGASRKDGRDVADELEMKPSENPAWVRVGENALVLEVNDAIAGYLDNLVKVGLYGQTPSDVAYTMLCRGIETLLTVAREPSSKRR
jgi:hypothetical protein